MSFLSLVALSFAPVLVAILAAALIPAARRGSRLRGVRDRRAVIYADSQRPLR